MKFQAIISNNSVIDQEFLDNLKSPTAISSELRRTLKQIWYLKMQQRKKSINERKADTRQKIQMGGLIKKAGLDYLHPHQAEIIYGLLKASKFEIDKNPDILTKWAELGKEIKNSSLNAYLL